MLKALFGGAEPAAGVSDGGKITLVLNGETVQVTNPDPAMTLAEWLRDVRLLKGTKISCAQGGCGACTVTLQPPSLSADADGTQVIAPVSANACLRKLCSMDGWGVTTIEGIGGAKKGYNVVQTTLAKGNGSQCGFCSPGMVMSMHSLLAKEPEPSPQDVEDRFDGNLCRCTGYRPILESMRTLAKPTEGEADECDVEDLHLLKQGPCTELPCGKYCYRSEPLRVVGADGSTWYKPTDAKTLYALLAAHSTEAVQLVVGNTSSGVFPYQKYSVFIDIAQIAQLKTVTASASGLTFGSTVTLSTVIETLIANKATSNSYMVLAAHLQRVASHPVRDVGCWAGNIRMALDHANFPSDVFTIFAGTGATINVYDAKAATYTNYHVLDLIGKDLAGCVFISVTIPALGADMHFDTFKAMPRAENAHAYVNAAFLLQVNPTTHAVEGSPRLVFGGVEARAVRATKTEAYLVGKTVASEATLHAAISQLSEELVPVDIPVFSSPAYRMRLVQNVFYKFFTTLTSVGPTITSAEARIPRPLSTSQQTYTTDPSTYPVSEAKPKLLALRQTSGEAVYTRDIKPQAGTLYAAFMTATTAASTLNSIDTSHVLQCPGVKKILLASDLPVNNYVPPAAGSPLPLFVPLKGQVEYYGQPVGLVLADTQEHADAAASQVVLALAEESKDTVPIVTLDDAIAAKSFIDSEMPSVKAGEPMKTALPESKHQITGSVQIGGQYHFHLETQVCYTMPQENGTFLVESATQSQDWTQQMLAMMTGEDQNKFIISTRRIGGAYGGKITGSLPAAAACSIASYLLDCPVSLTTVLSTNMQMIGKRHPMRCDYTVGYNDGGVLHAVDLKYYVDCGYTKNDSEGCLGAAFAGSGAAYYCANWEIDYQLCKTNTASNTACRAPGFSQAVYFMEQVMEAVAHDAGLDPDVVRHANLYQKGQMTPGGQELKYCSLSTLWETFVTTRSIAIRQAAIEVFNKANRWKKRGLAIMPNKYLIDFGGYFSSAYVAIYADGSVNISHGGIECGQGINTKVAQAAAMVLGCDIGLIVFRPTNTYIHANNVNTGGSVTSEMACRAVMLACNDIKPRIEAVSKTMPAGSTWPQVINKCYTETVDLTGKGWNTTPPTDSYYYSYGMVGTEVELDILTGEFQIQRTDILFDCGISLNPAVDIGQVEGGYMMGIGLFTSEQLKFDPSSGKMLTNSTWEYKPPCHKDIPVDFRVELLKDAPNPIGTLRSKASGEPPLNMSTSVLLAIMAAATASLTERFKPAPSTIDAPATVEHIQTMCNVVAADLVLE